MYLLIEHNNKDIGIILKEANGHLPLLNFLVNMLNLVEASPHIMPGKLQ